jgi:hypothetical protein
MLGILINTFLKVNAFAFYSTIAWIDIEPALLFRFSQLGRDRSQGSEHRGVFVIPISTLKELTSELDIGRSGQISD